MDEKNLLMLSLPTRLQTKHSVHIHTWLIYCPTNNIFQNIYMKFKLISERVRSSFQRRKRLNFDNNGIMEAYQNWALLGGYALSKSHLLRRFAD